MTRRKAPSRRRGVIYGAHPVIETIRAGKRSVEEIYLAREAEGIKGLLELLEASRVTVSRISSADIGSLAGSPHHQGIAAKVGQFPYADLEEVIKSQTRPSSLMVLLDEVQDPGNLGSIVRSAECLGGQAVVISKDRCVGVTAASEKASAGASAHIPIVRVVNMARTLGRLRDCGYWLYAADSRAEQTFYSADLKGKVGLVLGSEGKGLRRLVGEQCDFVASIPLLGNVESLNVAQTASIVMAEALRQRMSAKETG